MNEVKSHLTFFLLHITYNNFFITILLIITDHSNLPNSQMNIAGSTQTRTRWTSCPPSQKGLHIYSVSLLTKTKKYTRSPLLGSPPTGPRKPTLSAPAPPLSPPLAYLTCPRVHFARRQSPHAPRPLQTPSWFLACSSFARSRRGRHSCNMSVCRKTTNLWDHRCGHQGVVLPCGT
jgi:hypothetical protein